MKINRHLGDIFRHLGRVVDDLIVVSDKLDAFEHSYPPLHQVAGVLAGKHHFALPVTAGPQVVGDFFGQRAGHRVLGNTLFILVNHTTVLAEEHAAVRHRCKELAQTGILPSGRRAKQNPAPMQLPDLFKNFAAQLFFAVLQQRTVNVAADQSDRHFLPHFPRYFSRSTN